MGIVTEGTLELIKLMTRAGVPITRETFVNANWDGDPPRPWDWEAEEELPEELKEWPDPGSNDRHNGEKTR